MARLVLGESVAQRVVAGRAHAGEQPAVDGADPLDRRPGGCDRGIAPRPRATDDDRVVVEGPVGLRVRACELPELVDRRSGGGSDGGTTWLAVRITEGTELRSERHALVTLEGDAAEGAAARKLDEAETFRERDARELPRVGEPVGSVARRRDPREPLASRERGESAAAPRWIDGAGQIAGQARERPFEGRSSCSAEQLRAGRRHRGRCPARGGWPRLVRGVARLSQASASALTARVRGCRAGRGCVCRPRPGSRRGTSTSSVRRSR